MKKVCLQFPTLYALWEFAQTLKINTIEINTRKKTLTCDCNEEDLNKALTKYKAVIINDAQNQN